MAGVHDRHLEGLTLLAWVVVLLPVAIFWTERVGIEETARISVVLAVGAAAVAWGAARRLDRCGGDASGATPLVLAAASLLAIAAAIELGPWAAPVVALEAAVLIGLANVWPRRALREDALVGGLFAAALAGLGGFWPQGPRGPLWAAAVGLTLFGLGAAAVLARRGRERSPQLLGRAFEWLVFVPPGLWILAAAHRAPSMTAADGTILFVPYAICGLGWLLLGLAVLALARRRPGLLDLSTGVVLVSAGGGFVLLGSASGWNPLGGAEPLAGWLTAHWLTIAHLLPGLLLAAAVLALPAAWRRVRASWAALAVALILVGGELAIRAAGGFLAGGGFAPGSLFHSAAWALVALLLVVSARGRPSAGVAGLVVAGAVAAKVLLHDLSGLPALYHVYGWLAVVLVFGSRFASDGAEGWSWLILAVPGLRKEPPDRAGSVSA